MTEKKQSISKAKKTKKTSIPKKVLKLEEKVSLLEKNISDLETELAKFKDKNIRLLAEFENYKRRTRDEKNNLIRYSGEDLVMGILPILDDFQRTLDNASSDNVDVLREGVSMINNKLLKILNENHIKSFNSVGELFDPDLHEALMSESGDDDDIVLREFEKGYKYHERVIRHAKVVVSKVQ